MEDDPQWKTTLGGRRPFMEDNLRGKTTFDGRRSLMDAELYWKEDDLKNLNGPQQ